MAEKDITERLLASYNDVFADIVNGCFAILGGGRPFRRVSPDELQDTGARTMYKADGEVHEQERDVVKLWRAGGAVICLLGLENQTAVDPDMPLRVFGYEGGDYRLQLTRKGPERYPVLTLVLYFGTERRWPEERTLLSRLKVPEALRLFLNDCRVNVLEAAWLTDEQASVFTSDFRIVVEYFRQIRQNGDFGGTAQEMEHVDAVLKFLEAATGDRHFEVAQTLVGKGERVSMESVLGRVQAKGREEGREQVLFSLVDDGLISLGVAAAKANMSEAEFRARMERDRRDRQNAQ